MTESEARAIAQLVEEAIAEMFADSALRKYRVSCDCAEPMPDSFDELYWATCQGCGRQLSYLAYVERGKP
jgi:hypothetical protein